MQAPSPDQDDVVSRADAFMHRQRSTLSGTPSPFTAAAPEPLAQEDDDLPVLTDVVIADTPHHQTATLSRQEKLVDELTRQVRARIHAELPTLVESALQAALPGISRDIRQGLEESISSALSEHLSRLISSDS